MRCTAQYNNKTNSRCLTRTRTRTSATSETTQRTKMKFWKFNNKSYSKCPWSAPQFSHKNKNKKRTLTIKQRTKMKTYSRCPWSAPQSSPASTLNSSSPSFFCPLLLLLLCNSNSFYLYSFTALFSLGMACFVFQSPLLFVERLSVVGFWWTCST